MNNCEKYTIDIVNAGLNNTKFKCTNKDIPWDKIYEEAKAHDIVALMYYGINNKDIEPRELAEKWKRETIMSGVFAIKYSQQINDIFYKLVLAGVNPLLLKGMIVRELYPRKEFRTMKDGDILVPLDKVNEADKILKELGYTREEGNHSVHAAYHKEGSIEIELHWRLINEEFYQGKAVFEKSLWDRIDNHMLSKEDFLLHLFTHMAVHLAYSGFGIRQLIDVVLFVNKYRSEINWEFFVEEIKNCGVSKLARMVFEICNILFFMEIPKEILLVDEVTYEECMILIKEIFKAGVRGKRDSANVFVNEVALKINFKDLMFPSIKDLNDKYSYAKRCNILLPIAWIHHFFVGVANSNYNFSDKVKMLFFTKYKSNKKNQLIKLLKL